MIEILKKAAEAAGEVIRKNYRTGRGFTYKSGIHDIVTETDIESQNTIIKTINEEVKKQFSDRSVGFLTEEVGGDIKGDLLFIIDPIDGTSNFESGIPYFCVSIGVAKRGELVAGLVYNPVTRDCFFAEKGKGAYWNNKKIHIRKGRSLQDSVIISYRPATVMLSIHKPFFARDVRIFGASALDLCYVASGMGDIFLTRRLNVWDYAAAAVIVEEAGGRLCDWRGLSFEPVLDDRLHIYPVVAGEPELLKKFLPYIKSFDPYK